ncbi:cytochrome P450 [Aspergillus spinulosporus]
MIETFSTWLFGTACVLLILNEIYFSLLQYLSISSIYKIAGDFLNHRYYRPWAAKPIVIPATREMMTELSEATVLSQRAVYADMFGFRHTLNNLDHNEINTRKSRLFSRVLQVRVPAQFRELYPCLYRNLKAFLDMEIQAGGTLALALSTVSNLGVEQEGIASAGLASLSERLLSRLMGVWFFGENITSDPHFCDALLSHPRQIKACAAAFQLTPKWLASPVHTIITRRGKAMHLIQNTLIDLLTARLETWDEPPETKKLTLLYHLFELSEPNRDYWTPETLSQSILGLWLAASHQPWVNLHAILLELCVRPEWQDVLCKEALEHQDDLASKIDQLPLLDSFMRETARFNSLDKVAIRRKALADYTFSLGSPVVRAGSILCVSSYDQTRNDKIYPDPEQFDGMRFLNGRCKDKSSRFADVSENHLIWGYGSLACPGRHASSFILKMTIVHLVTSYTMRLADVNAPRWWSWEDFTIPYASTRVLFSKRETSGLPC